MFFFKIRLVLHRLWITHTKDKYGILDTEDVEIIAKGNSGLTLDKDSNKMVFSMKGKEKDSSH